MARDGSGNYSRVEGPYVNGAVADADEINNELNDIGSALSDSINRAGTKAMAADLPMGGHKLTGLAAGSATGESVRYEQLTALSSVYQPLDALLTAIAGLTTADDRMLDFTGTDTVAVVTYATVLTNIAAQPLDSDLTAIAALTTTAMGRSLLALADPNADAIYFWDDSADGWATLTLPPGFTISTTSLLAPETWMVALSDETTTITTGTNRATLVFPYDVTVVSVGCSVNTAGTGLTVDINEGGVSILSTKLTLDSGEKTSLTADVPAVISDASIAAGAEVGFDIDAASGTSKGLKVWLVVRRTT